MTQSMWWWRTVREGNQEEMVPGSQERRVLREGEAVICFIKCCPTVTLNDGQLLQHETCRWPGQKLIQWGSREEKLTGAGWQQNWKRERRNQEMISNRLLSSRARILTHIFLTSKSGDFTTGEEILNQKPVGLSHLLYNLEKLIQQTSLKSYFVLGTV